MKGEIKKIQGFIKHRGTEQYYQGDGKWTEDEEKAMDFESLTSVVEEARKYNIKDCCEFIMRIVGNPGFTVFLAL
jgi:hypothetical protein